MNNESFAKRNIIKQRPVLSYCTLGGADKKTHTHPHPEFIFVLSGSGRLEIAGNQYPIKSGDLVICGKNVPHSEYMFDATDGMLYHLGFERTMIGELPEDEIITEPFCLIHTGEQCGVITTYFGVINAEFASRQLCGNIMESDLLRVLLVTALRLAVGDMGIAYAKDKVFYEAKNYIDRNYTSGITVDDVCKTLDVNKFYLTHIFKLNLNIPPIKYLLNKRMTKAKTLLAATDDPISAIAEKCGYDDTAYFCRVFKNAESMTPLQYRSKLSKIHSD